MEFFAPGFDAVREAGRHVAYYMHGLAGLLRLEKFSVEPGQLICGISRVQ